MINRIAFIASLGHSGSTMLELMLCGHGQCLGIGEAYQVADGTTGRLSEVHERSCACGDMITACPFWSRVVDDLRARAPFAPGDAYRAILERARSQYPTKTALVDSAKVLPAVELWRKLPGLDVRIVHLVRDVRAYAVSMARAHRKGEGGSAAGTIWRQGVRGLYRSAQRTRWSYFLDWYQTNRRIERYAAEHGLPILQVRYEELCFEPEATMLRVAGFLGLDFEAAMTGMTAPDCHNIFGNRMKTQASAREKVRYDFGWLSERTWVLPSLLLSHVMDYNNRDPGRRQSR